MNEVDAIIEVTRRRPIYFGLIGPPYSVFIDGVDVGRAPRGKTVRFPVAPGSHHIKVWTSTGKAQSNELVLNVAAGEHRSLICQANGAAIPMGLSQAPTQIRTLRSLIKNGGVQENAIKLYEDPPKTTQ